MMAPNDDARYPEHLGGNMKSAMGWTKVHSWIFLVIVTASLGFMAFQNRYHYFPPQGSGKTYRVDKLSGQPQQYDPDRGWVPAEMPLDIAPALSPQPAVVVPSGDSSRVPRPKQPEPTPVVQDPGPEFLPPVHNRAVVPKPPPTPVITEPSKDEKWVTFHEAFPDFGKEEFNLAADDLYPNWKKNVDSSGTWPQFLDLYRRFIDWWMKSGSPAASGLDLWKDFMKTKPR